MCISLAKRARDTILAREQVLGDRVLTALLSAFFVASTSWLLFRVAVRLDWTEIPSNVAEFVALTTLTIISLMILVRRIMAMVHVTQESSPKFPTPDWCMRLARRSGRPLGVIQVAAELPGSRHIHLSLEEQDRLICRTLKDSLRSVDFLALNGSSAVWIVCPDTDAQGLLNLASRLQHALTSGGVSARFGVASFPEDGFTLNTLFDIASQRASLAPKVRESIKGKIEYERPALL
jgi:hypothetical protein